MNSISDYSNIAVIGGGNIGTLFACVCAYKGYSVNMFSSKPNEYDVAIEAIDEHQNIITGKLNKITDSIEEAIKDCGLVIVTYPAFMLNELALSMLPYVTPKMTICVVPGTGGAEFAFRDCISKGAVLCGLQRVPAIARLETYGRRVKYAGLRKELCLAAIPRNRTNGVADFISKLWGIPCTCLSNYLNVTLTPSNPILHTTRLRTLFADYVKGNKYDRNPLFYGEWNDASSELLLACDDELQQLCRTLDRLDLSGVLSLRFHYESETKCALTNKLRSINSLHNISSPMKQTERGWIPDFESRYFTADFPYGLAIIEEFADIVGLDVPNIKETMEWYRSVTGSLSGFRLSDYNISAVNDIYDLYLGK